MSRPTIRPFNAAAAAVLGVALLAGGGYTAAQLLTSHDTAPTADSRGAAGGSTGVTGSAGAGNGPSESAAPTSSASAPSSPASSGEPTPAATVAPALFRLDDSSSTVRDLEARLAQRSLLATRWVDGTFGTATRSAVVTFQESKGLAGTGEVDQATWDALRGATRTPTHEELYPVVKPAPVIAGGRLDPRCMEGRVLCIDKTTRTLAWVVDGTVQKRIAVRFGSEFHPTREGVFDVYYKDIDHVSNLYGSKMPYAMFFSGGEAVHFSTDFAARGYAGASHGCVNTRDKSATAYLFGQVHVGDAVVVYHSSTVTPAPTAQPTTPKPTTAPRPTPSTTAPKPSTTPTTTKPTTSSTTSSAAATSTAATSTAAATGSAS